MEIYGILLMDKVVLSRADTEARTCGYLMVVLY